VPRQLVTIQSVNSGEIKFQNNEVSGSTGGLTIDGTPSYNTAVTIDPVGAVLTGNTIDTESGTGYSLRVRGLNAEVSNNSSPGTSAGYYILPNHSLNVLIPVGTMISNSSKYWVCIQEHTSSATNAPTGAEGTLYWSEITLEDVNASESFGIGEQSIGSNSNVLAVLLTVGQESAGQPVSVAFDKELLKQISKVSSDPVFSVEANWRMVACIYKHSSSASRLTAGFREFEITKEMKLKAGMVSGQAYEIVKMIISTPDRSLLVLKRSDIEDASSFDFVLK
jgi:hypothetical protein